MCLIQYQVLTVLACCVTASIQSSVRPLLRPMAALKPLGAVITFTCEVNISELHQFVGISWIVDSLVLPGSNRQVIMENGTALGTLQQSLTQVVTAVPVECVVHAIGQSWDTPSHRSENSTLTVYGPPEAPSNLTSTQSSSNALLLSWSAPSSPGELHYTVTVRLTNTNSTSTTTITMFNTSSTTITITKEDLMAAIDSTVYGGYCTFSVTATNPAGNSTPANITIPAIIPSAIALHSRCNLSHCIESK